jgi:hypothetical protein
MESLSHTVDEIVSFLVSFFSYYNGWFSTVFFWFDDVEVEVECDSFDTSFYIIGEFLILIMISFCGFG